MQHLYVDEETTDHLFVNLSQESGFLKKWSRKKKYDKLEAELEIEREILERKGAAAPEDNSGKPKGFKKTAGEKLAEEKQAVNHKYLMDHHRGMMDRKQLLMQQKFLRERHQVVHCCRFFVNLVLMILLMVWLPLTNNSDIEYQLWSTINQKAS